MVRWFLPQVCLDFAADCRQLRINGKGRKTYVADLKTTIHFIWALPGHHANEFKRECAECRCFIEVASMVIVMLASMERGIIRCDELYRYLTNTISS